MTVVKIQPRSRASLGSLSELWQYRELLFFFVWRDVKVRYAQTALGILWVILQPIITMAVYTVLFTKVVNLSNTGVPYPIFVLAGIVPWNFFSSSLNRCTSSLVASSSLLTKVYFPRLLIPISAVISGIVDLVVTLLLLFAAMIVFQIKPSLLILGLPFVICLSILTALAFGLWLATLNVKYRDVGYIIPFLLQVWMFATPIFYSSAILPERFKMLAQFNPLIEVVEGFRYCLLTGYPISPNFTASLAFCFVEITVILLLGVVYFQANENEFADVI